MFLSLTFISSRSDDLEDDESDTQLDTASNQVGILPWKLGGADFE